MVIVAVAVSVAVGVSVASAKEGKTRSAAIINGVKFFIMQNLLIFGLQAVILQHIGVKSRAKY